MDAGELPAPLVSAEVDLRGMPFMPLDIVRLIDSDLFALSTGDEFKAALTLWCKAWQQVPAASLPNDDRVLAHLSGAGAKWRRVKTVALRRFVECADGRLYHPVIAEKAQEAWKKRAEYQERREHERQRQKRHRGERGQLFAQLRAISIVPQYETATGALREMLSNASVTRDSDVTSQESNTGVTRDVTAKTGTGTGTGTATGIGTGQAAELPLATQPARPAVIKNAPSRGTRLPDEWAMPEEWAVEAIKLLPDGIYRGSSARRSSSPTTGARKGNPCRLACRLASVVEAGEERRVLAPGRQPCAIA